MNYKTMVIAASIVALFGCNPKALHRPGETIPTTPTTPTTPTPTPVKPITVTTCSTEISAEIKSMGNNYTVEKSLNGDIHHDNYRWQVGAPAKNESYRVYFTWGGPYKGCVISRFATFTDSSFIPSGECKEEAQGILDNFGGVAESVDTFINSTKAEYTYSWFDDGFYYKFENEFATAGCVVSSGNY